MLEAIEADLAARLERASEPERMREVERNDEAAPIPELAVE